MPKNIRQTEIKVKVNIKPVKLGETTPYQRQLVKKFWSRLIAAVKADEREGATDTIKESQPRPPQ